MSDLTTAQLDELRAAVAKMSAAPWLEDEDRRPGGADQIIDADDLTVAFISTADGDLPSRTDATGIILLRNNAEALIAAARQVGELEQQIERQARQVGEFINANQDLRERVAELEADTNAQAKLSAAFIERYTSSGVANWIGWVTEHDGAHFECQIQRVGGKTTTEWICELERRIGSMCNTHGSFRRFDAHRGCDICTHCETPFLIMELPDAPGVAV